MRGGSRPLRGLGPYNVREVAIGLAALGIAGIAWGAVTAQIGGAFAWPPLVAGIVLLFAGLAVWRWDVAHPR